MLKISQENLDRFGNQQSEIFFHDLTSRLQTQFPEHFFSDTPDTLNIKVQDLIDFAKHHGLTCKEEIAQFAAMTIEAGGEERFAQQLEGCHDILGDHQQAESLRIVLLRHRLEERATLSTVAPSLVPIRPNNL